MSATILWPSGPQAKDGVLARSKQRKKAAHFHTVTEWILNAKVARAPRGRKEKPQTLTFFCDLCAFSASSAVKGFALAPAHQTN